eukprot:Colp12_sorted_trinity150504_noHs@975
MGVIYEVNLSVNNEVREQYQPWLEKHIAEMLELPGKLFERACMYTRYAEDEGAQAGDQTLFTVHYYTTRQALDFYFNTYAAAMRQDGMNRFGGKFTATRRILEEWKSYIS